MNKKQQHFAINNQEDEDFQGCQFYPFTLYNSNIREQDISYNSNNDNEIEVKGNQKNNSDKQNGKNIPRDK